MTKAAVLEVDRAKVMAYRIAAHQLDRSGGRFVDRPGVGPAGRSGDGPGGGSHGVGRAPHDTA